MKIVLSFLVDSYFSTSTTAFLPSRRGGRGIFGGEIKKVQKKFAQVSKSLYLCTAFRWHTRATRCEDCLMV